MNQLVKFPNLKPEIPSVLSNLGTSLSCTMQQSKHLFEEVSLIPLLPHTDEYYNNNVHSEGVRFICGPHLAIIGPSEARADLMAR